MSLLAAWEAEFAKDEQWVVAEFQKGWADIQKLEAEGAAILATAAVDIKNVFAWVQTHHQDILNVFQAALNGLGIAANLVPGLGPAVSTATLAIDAGTAAIDSLSTAVIAGSVPMTTMTNAYHAVKDAANAANAVLKMATSKPATV